MTFRAGLVGLGQIGMGYDYYESPDKRVVSHASALVVHPAFELVGAVDLSPIRRGMFQRKYGKPAYQSLGEMLNAGCPHLMIVATPTSQHATVFDRLRGVPSLRLVLCEKPFGRTLSDAEGMLAIAKRENFDVAVNYIRAYDPGMQELLKRLGSGEIGFPLRCSVWYRKGLFNSGSHFLNLFLNVLGDVKEIKNISHGGFWDETDPEPNVTVVCERGEMHFLVVSEGMSAFNTVEIHGPKGRVVVDENNKICCWSRVFDENLDSAVSTSQTNEEIRTDMNRYQYNVLENLGNYLSGNAGLFCDGSAGLATMRVLHQIQAAVT